MKVVVLNVHYTKVLGGSELQCHLIASGLHEAGVGVTYLAVRGVADVSNFPYPVLNTEDSAKGIIENCLAVKPDIVYWRYNKKHFNQVMTALHQKGIPLIFSSSNAYDLKPFRLRPAIGVGILKQWKRYGGQLRLGFKHNRALKLVSGIVCNNEAQIDWQKHKHRIYIPNSPFLEFETQEFSGPYAIWVGNLKYHKNPDMFVDLAKDLAHTGLKFVMIGHMEDARFRYLEDQEKVPDNFIYLGKQPIEKTNGFIQGSQFLVHTGGPEGFPNVFLQTWGLSKPVISLEFDPAGLILSEAIGRLSGSYDQLKQDIIELNENESLREEIGANAHALIASRFVKELNVKKLIGFMKKVISNK